LFYQWLTWAAIAILCDAVNLALGLANPDNRRGTLPHRSLFMIRAEPLATTPGTPQVILYSKPGCHLCEEARDEIESVRSRQFDLTEINIVSDLSLYDLYKNDIPVIFINGREAFRHRLTASDFLRALSEAR